MVKPVKSPITASDVGLLYRHAIPLDHLEIELRYPPQPPRDRCVLRHRLRRTRARPHLFPRDLVLQRPAVSPTRIGNVRITMTISVISRGDRPACIAKPDAVVSRAVTWGYAVAVLATTARTPASPRRSHVVASVKVNMEQRRHALYARSRPEPLRPPRERHVSAAHHPPHSAAPVPPGLVLPSELMLGCSTPGPPPSPEPPADPPRRRSGGSARSSISSSPGCVLVDHAARRDKEDWARPGAQLRPGPA